MNSRPKLSFASFFELLRSTFTAFGEDRVARHASSLAYYTVFAMSPMVVVLISIAALYFQDQARATGAITAQLQETVGKTAGKAIEDMILSATNHGSSDAKPIFATIFALLVALWGASGLFGALQDSLNAIWGVELKPEGGWMNLVRSRFLSFAMVLVMGFLLLVSLVLSTVLAALSHSMNGVTGDSAILGQIVNFPFLFS